MIEINDFNSLEETTEILRIPNPEILRRMAKAKKIGHIKQGAKYVFPRESIEDYKRLNTVAPIVPHPSGMTEQSLRRLRA